MLRTFQSIDAYNRKFFDSQDIKKKKANENGLKGVVLSVFCYNGNLVTPLWTELRCGGASRGCDRRLRLALTTTDVAD